MLETPDRDIPPKKELPKRRWKQFLQLYVLTFVLSHTGDKKTKNREWATGAATIISIKDRYGHPVIKTHKGNQVPSLLTSQRSNNKIGIKSSSRVSLCLDHWERDLEASQNQKLNLSVSVCASWHQRMMKPLEEVGDKVIQQTTGNNNLSSFPSLVELRDWYGIFKVKLMQKASARRVQEAVSCPGTITAHSNRKAARLWGAKMTSASAIK